MSASREKKQRQSAGPSEKALQAQQQQAARKRKTIIYTVVGVVIVGLVAALLIWNSGFFQARATAATVGDTTLSTAELSYYYYNARQTYVMYGSYLGFDASKPDDEQTYTGDENKTFRDHFLETALSSAQRDIALAAEALKNGHTEAEVKEDLDAHISSVKAQGASYGYGYSAFLKANYGSYMSAGLYKQIFTRALLAQIAQNEKSEALSDSYTTEDLETYYGEDDHADAYDTFEYSYLYFTPKTVETKDKDGNDIDEDKVNAEKELALAEAKTKADEALKALKDGDKLADVAKKYELTESNIADHTTTVGTSGIPSAIQEKLLALKEGEFELVENGESGYYVITFHGRERVEDPTQDVRHILALAEHTTDDDGKLVAPTDEAWAAAKEKIDAIVAEYESGDKSEDSFAKLANEKSDDGDGTTGGLYTKIDPASRYVPEFLDWIFEDGRKPGDTGVVQHSAEEGATSGYYGYHFMYLVGDNEAKWARDVRSALTEQDLNAWMEELNKGFETSLSNGANYLGR